MSEQCGKLRGTIQATGALAGSMSGRGTLTGAVAIPQVVGGGNYHLQAKSVTPTKEQQSVAPDAGYYGLSAVTVGAIPEDYQDVSATTAAPGDVWGMAKITSMTRCRRRNAGRHHAGQWRGRQDHGWPESHVCSDRGGLHLRRHRELD